MILLAGTPRPDHAITAEHASRHLAVGLGRLDGPHALGRDGDHVPVGLAAADLQPHGPGVPRAVALVELQHSRWQVTGSRLSSRTSGGDQGSYFTWPVSELTFDTSRATSSGLGVNRYSRSTNSPFLSSPRVWMMHLQRFQPS
jgi:hypothetical protein